MTALIKTQIETLINKSFDSKGMLINPNSRNNKKESQRLIDLGVLKGNEILDGFNIHTSLLIIANPNRDI